MKILIKNATVIKDVKTAPFKGDILINNDIIEQIEENISTPETDRIIDAAGMIAIPGFIQTHVHLAQTIFRNMAEDVSLLDWLNRYILPFESQHTAKTLYDSARLGIAELLLSGTTTIQDMETVLHTDASFKAVYEMGIRASMGNMLMDTGNDILAKNIDFLMAESETLYKKWNDKDNGRIKYVLTPRFALSCTKELFLEIRKMSDIYDIPVHSHAAENIEETKIVKQQTGYGNIEYFEKLGLCNEKLRLAHCIWLNDYEYDILKSNGVNVLHCPTANFKLGSGTAKIPEMLTKGINVSLGADGPPCNNNLNIFNEMKLAGLIQKVRLGPESMNAKEIFKMATAGGAKALGMEKEIGTLGIGKKADITILKPNVHSLFYDENSIFNSIIYSMNRDNVTYTIVDGNILVDNGILRSADIQSIIREAELSRNHFNPI